MKSLGLYTILLGFVAVSILVSAVLMGFTIYKIASAAAGATVADLWKDNKLFIITPTVVNVLALILVGVMYVTG